MVILGVFLEGLENTHTLTKIYLKTVLLQKFDNLNSFIFFLYFMQTFPINSIAKHSPSSQQDIQMTRQPPSEIATRQNSHPANLHKTALNRGAKDILKL